MEEKNMTIGKRIAECRKKYSLTQQALADKIDGITVQMINAYERDKQIPSMKNLIKISEVLNASLDYLCKGKIENKSESFILEEYGTTNFGAAMKAFAIIDNTGFFKLRLSSNSPTQKSVVLESNNLNVYELCEGYKKLRDAREYMGEQRFIDSLNDLIEKYTID